MLFSEVNRKAYPFFFLAFINRLLVLPSFFNGPVAISLPAFFSNNALPPVSFFKDLLDSAVTVEAAGFSILTAAGAFFRAVCAAAKPVNPVIQHIAINNFFIPAFLNVVQDKIIIQFRNKPFSILFSRSFSALWQQLNNLTKALVLPAK